MFCPMCGANLPNDSAFCSQCGRPTGIAGQRPYQSTGATAAQMAATAGAAARNAVSSAASKLNEMAGGSGAVKLGFKDFFVEVFKKHSAEEAEELFMCGTPSTTPPLDKVSTAWPRPWLWSRVLVVLIVTFIGLVLLYRFFGNYLAMPGIMFIGALLIDFAMLIFFFETNAPRNISIAKVVKLFFVGGVASLLLVMTLINIIPGSGSGDIVASLLTGLIEEVAKIAIIVFFMSRMRGRHFVLNGLLIGAAVGAGFSVFENAGYAFNSYSEFFMSGINYSFSYGESIDLIDLGYQGVMGSTAIRLLGNLGGHTAWAAVEGAALALCEKGNGFSTSQLLDPRFLTFAGICIVMHGLWDMYIPVLDDIAIPFTGTLTSVILIIAVWVIIAVMLNRGLAQINGLTHNE